MVPLFHKFFINPSIIYSEQGVKKLTPANKREQKKNKMAIVSFSLIGLSALLVILCFWTSLNEIDVLVDGKFELDKKSYDAMYRGSTNQRIINVKEFSQAEINRADQMMYKIKHSSKNLVKVLDEVE